MHILVIYIVICVPNWHALLPQDFPQLHKKYMKKIQKKWWLFNYYNWDHLYGK